MAGLITQATQQQNTTAPVVQQSVTGKVTPQVTDPVYTQPGGPMPGTPEDGPTTTGATGWDGSVNGLVPGDRLTQPGETDPTGGTGQDPNVGGDGAIPMPKPGDIDPNKPPPDDGLTDDGIVPPGDTTPGGTYSTNPNAGADPGPYQGNTDWNTITGQTDMMNQGLIDMLDSNNPLMQRAALTGRRAANARGLGSSSFSERAAQGAVFDIALPMVQQASQQAAAFENLARQQGFASSQAMLDRQLREFEQTRDIEYREWMQNTTLQHQELLQTSELAQYSYSNFMNAAMEILNNPETSDDQKEAAMLQLQRALDNSLALLDGTSNVDLSAFLPGGYQGQPPTTGNPGGPTIPGGGGGGAGGGGSYGGQYGQFAGEQGSTAGGFPIERLGGLNTNGGLSSLAGDWGWGDVGGTMIDGASAIGQSFLDNVIVEQLESSFPGLFQDDSVWSQVLGLGINLTMTPLNVLYNLISSAYDYLSGDEEASPDATDASQVESGGGGYVDPRLSQGGVDSMGTFRNAAWWMGQMFQQQPSEAPA